MAILFLRLAMFSLLSTTVLPLSIERRSTPQHQVPCDPAAKYVTNWFLANTNRGYGEVINGKAIFYTGNASSNARELACKDQDNFMTIWQVWPRYLHDRTDVPSNPMRCIHLDRASRTNFYKNMSQAYARMARGTATIMHSAAEHKNPPTNGYWGTVELPTLRDKTDVFTMGKMNADTLHSEPWEIVNKGPWYGIEKAMGEVLAIFHTVAANARNHGHSGSSTDGNPCVPMSDDTYSFYDNLM